MEAYQKYLSNFQNLFHPRTGSVFPETTSEAYSAFYCQHELAVWHRDPKLLKNRCSHIIIDKLKKLVFPITARISEYLKVRSIKPSNNTWHNNTDLFWWCILGQISLGSTDSQSENLPRAYYLPHKSSCQFANYLMAQRKDTRNQTTNNVEQKYTLSRKTTQMHCWRIKIESFLSLFPISSSYSRKRKT